MLSTSNMLVEISDKAKSRLKTAGKVGLGAVAAGVAGWQAHKHGGSLLNKFKSFDSEKSGSTNTNNDERRGSGQTNVGFRHDERRGSGQTNVGLKHDKFNNKLKELTATS
jgi:hypothetical protein